MSISEISFYEKLVTNQFQPGLELNLLWSVLFCMSMGHKAIDIFSFVTPSPFSHNTPAILFPPHALALSPVLPRLFFFRHPLGHSRHGLFNNSSICLGRYESGPGACSNISATSRHCPGTSLWSFPGFAQSLAV